MNDKYLPEVLDIQSVCLVRVPSSRFRVIGDIIISSVLFVCRTYKKYSVRALRFLFTKRSARAENQLLNLPLFVG
jgi:hypothetical protein